MLAGLGTQKLLGREELCCAPFLCFLSRRRNGHIFVARDRAQLRSQDRTRPAAPPPRLICAQAGTGPVNRKALAAVARPGAAPAPAWQGPTTGGPAGGEGLRAALTKSGGRGSGECTLRRWALPARAPPPLRM